MFTSPPFVLFGSAHLITLALIAAVAILLPLALRRYAPAALRPVAVVLAALLLAQEAVDVAMQLWRFGPSVQLLPLHLCTLALLVTAWMLVTRSPRVFEVAYFWALGGTTQALATPDLRQGFPDPAFLFFFAGHGLVVIGVAHGVLALGLRPYPASIVRVALITLALAAVVLLINLALGTNFLYLMAKPAGASLLDWLGPWPWYWLGLVAVALASFLVLYAPFFAADLLRAARPAVDRRSRGRGWS
ncbi:TIGR02206 family membrane protein [uncultured Thiohalocapsa sp.]|uniref:YwaF family protein n=1 Tax=uncultured Thiohalocapsa sp. TaxID=768990 RepID=UPI0025E47577|nr:TIGR02206 family membrane protein [uncultured Thiohalocapsa sp.]